MRNYSYEVMNVLYLRLVVSFSFILVRDYTFYELPKTATYFPAVQVGALTSVGSLM